MIRAALIVALAAGPALGQGFIPDEFTMERVTPDLALVEYWNSDTRQSAYAPRELTVGDLTVDLRLTITRGPEKLEVFPPAGWVADPPRVVVEDGAYGRIEVRRELAYEGM